MVEKLGGPRHGPCLCGAASGPAHEGPRGGLFSQHDFSRRTSFAGRKPGLFDDQACGGGICRESRDLAQGAWHPQVLGYMRKKTENYDRWISGMAKIQAKMREDFGK